MNLSGTWINQQGSTMEITVADNKITGFYLTKKGSPNPTDKFELTGYTNGELLCFMVNFLNKNQNHHSLTAWVGRYVKEDTTEKIYTVWHLAKKYTDSHNKEKTERWNTFLTNASVFEKVAL